MSRNVESYQWPTIPKKMKTRERQENAMETRSAMETRGDLTEAGRSTRAK